MQFITLNNGLLAGMPFDPALGTASSYGLDEETCRAWNDTVDAAQYDPSCSAPAWQLSFHDSFAPDRRVFIHAERGNAIAFAEGFFQEGLPCLTPLEAHWFSGCPLLGYEADQLFAHCFSAILQDYEGKFPGFIISALTPGSMLLRSLMAAFRRWYHFRPYAQPEQRSASLRGGMDGWLSRRSGNFRCKMKKARRRAEEQGIRFERHVPASHEEADALYARMLDVESRSWKGAANSGISETPSREFYHAMMHRLAVGPQAGCARVMFATHEGRDIGFIFGSLSGGELTTRPMLFSPWGMPVQTSRSLDPRGSVYRGQQFSFDQEWREFSVGDLLQFRQMEWLCEEGVARYDMGMSDDPRMAYKAHWAETVRQQETWIMLPKSSCSLIV